MAKLQNIVTAKNLLASCLFFTSVHCAAIDLSPYKGKVVYMDFWASWCNPCLKSFPWMESLTRKFDKNLVVITVNIDTDPAQADTFLQHHKFNAVMLTDKENTISREYQVHSIPTSLLFDKNGLLIETFSGFNAENTVLREDKIQKAISANN